MSLGPTEITELPDSVQGPQLLESLRAPGPNQSENRNVEKKGDENYKTHDDGSHPCVGCGYHDGIKWWKKYNNYTQYQNTLIDSMKSFIKYQGEQYSDETDDE